MRRRTMKKRRTWKTMNRTYPLLVYVGALGMVCRHAMSTAGWGGLGWREWQLDQRLLLFSGGPGMMF